MAPLRVLICGGSVAGPALAHWLWRLGHTVTVLERADSLRTAGQQIDLRGQGVQAMQKMGIEAAVRAKVVNEEGLRFVDSSGKQVAFMGANKSGKGAQTFTSEFEILRGDLCRILYDVTKEHVTWVFGKYVTSYTQDEEGVTVKLSDGSEERYDLLVGADGQNSRTRRLMLGTEAGTKAFNSLGVYFSYFNIPSSAEEEYVGTWYAAPHRRMILTRKDKAETLQAYLGIMSDDQRLKDALNTNNAAAQRIAMADIFEDAGWEAKRITDCLRERGKVDAGPEVDNFYYHEVGRVMCDAWSHGRVTLLGDAGYCPSPLSGQGTSTALIGAWVLAGEISKHCPAQNSTHADIRKALDAYETCLRPFVDKVQAMPARMLKVGYPESAWAIKFAQTALWLLTTLKVDKLAAKFGSDMIPGWDLPEYEELSRLVSGQDAQ